MINLTDIINAVLALVAALITAFVIPWIKANTSLTQQDRMRDVCSILVFAAEQMYGAGRGEEKLAYVKKKLQERGYTVDIDMIEATVNTHFGHWYDGDKKEETTDEESTEEEEPQTPLM